MMNNFIYWCYLLVATLDSYTFKVHYVKNLVLSVVFVDNIAVFVGNNFTYRECHVQLLSF